MPEFDLGALFPTESEESIYARVVGDLPPAPNGLAYNVRPGSALYGLMYPFAAEIARRREEGIEAFRQSHLTFAAGVWLDQIATDFGVSRLPAQVASVTVTITGAAGTVVPATSLFATPGNSVTGDPGLVFATLDAVTLTGGTGTVRAIAQAPGAAGNAGAGTVTIIVGPLTGVTGVTNTASVASRRWSPSGSQ